VAESFDGADNQPVEEFSSKRKDFLTMEAVAPRKAWFFTTQTFPFSIRLFFFSASAVFESLHDIL
jgi:hypothetical protein